MKSETYLEWIAPSLIRHRDGENLRNTPLDIKALPALKEIYHHPSEWRVHWISDTELEEALEEERSEESLLTYVKAFEPVPIESLFKDQILEQLLWRYPHQSATRHRSKQSVSEIKRLKEVRDEYSGLDIISTFKKPITSRPKFMQEKIIAC